MNELQLEPPRKKGTDWVTIVIVGFMLLGALVMGYQQIGAGDGLLPEHAPAPDFTVTTVKGGTVHLAELKGRVVMLDFWATWCGPCREELPYLVTIAQEYEAKGVTFVAASQDDLDDPKAQKEIVESFVGQALPELQPFAAFSTEPMAQAYLVKALPTLYVIDRSGRVVETHQAVTSERSIRRALDRALAIAE